MNLHQKLLELQKAVTFVAKDGKNMSDKYDYTSSSGILSVVRPKMDELGLLLFMDANDAVFHEGMTKSGTTRFLVEVWYTFTWVDVDSGEKLSVKWYSNGADLAGEKAPGKAATYAEKQFLLKNLHIPTDRDDPDRDAKSKSGEPVQKGTAAAKETAEYCRKAILQMLGELYSRDVGEVENALQVLTKSDERGFAGVRTVDELTDSAAQVTYGKLKPRYEKKTGKKFTFDSKEGDTDADTV